MSAVGADAGGGLDGKMGGLPAAERGGVSCLVGVVVVGVAVELGGGGMSDSLRGEKCLRLRIEISGVTDPSGLRLGRPGQLASISGSEMGTEGGVVVDGLVELWLPWLPGGTGGVRLRDTDLIMSGDERVEAATTAALAS